MRLKYLLHRILFFIPTLIIITILAFVISTNAPGDPVVRMMSVAAQDDLLRGESEVQLEQKIFWTHKLGLDLPVFYFSLVPLSFPDTLYRIYDSKHRSTYKMLLLKSGNWNAVEKYKHAVEYLRIFYNQLYHDSLVRSQLPADEIYNALSRSRNIIYTLPDYSDMEIIDLKLNQLDTLCRSYDFLAPLCNQIDSVEDSFSALLLTQCWKNLIPTIRFHAHNQYHRWVFGDGNWLTGKGSTYTKGLIRGDLGQSYYSSLPVSTIIGSRIGWSLFFTVLSVLLAYVVSIPIGLYSALKSGTWFDRSSSVFLLLLQSMPAFWVATMLLILFANPDVLDWFPASGVKPVTGYPADVTFLGKLRLSVPYLILPLIAYTYSSLALLSRITRASVLDVLQQEYIKTARAKGLNEWIVLIRHAFRNALLPLITLLANILPAAIGGSVILETIFSIPGMGYATYAAIQSQDYPVVIGVFTITGVLTLVGYLIADLLYAIADPRISFNKKYN